MPWPSIPNLIMTDLVAYQAVSWSQDDARGRKPTYAAARPEISASVSAAGASDQAMHSRESHVISHVVTIQGCDKPSTLKIRDRWVWAEGNKILTVQGVEPAGDGRGRIWNCYCEEHPLS